MTANPSGPKEMSNNQKPDPFVQIVRAFSAPDATEEEVLRKAINMRHDAENTPAEVRRQRALDALAAIQRAFQESGITEEELLAEGRRVRGELSRSYYGQMKDIRRERRKQ